MKIRLGRKQSFWRPLNPANEKDLTIYLCPVQPFMELDWEVIPEWVKGKIRSSEKLGLITTEGLPEVVKEEPTVKEPVIEIASIVEEVQKEATPEVKEVQKEATPEVKEVKAKSKAKKKVSTKKK